MYKPQDVGNGSTDDGGNWLLEDPETGKVVSMAPQNAFDLIQHRGWKRTDIPSTLACEACRGFGKFPRNSQEPCWHCGGDGVDPTKEETYEDKT